MRHCVHGSLGALALVLLGGCANNADPDKGWVVVEVSPVAKGMCLIQSKEIRCEDAPSYLRQTLRTPVDASVKVKCPKPCTKPDDTIPVLDALKAAGYRLAMGELEI